MFQVLCLYMYLGSLSIAWNRYNNHSIRFFTITKLRKNIYRNNFFVFFIFLIFTPFPTLVSEVSRGCQCHFFAADGMNECYLVGMQIQAVGRMPVEHVTLDRGV